MNSGGLEVRPRFAVHNSWVGRSGYSPGAGERGSSETDIVFFIPSGLRANSGNFRIQIQAIFGAAGAQNQALWGAAGKKMAPQAPKIRQKLKTPKIYQIQAIFAPPETQAQKSCQKKKTIETESENVELVFARVRSPFSRTIIQSQRNH